MPGVGSIRAKRISYCLKDPLTRERTIDEIRLAIDAAQGNATRAARALEVCHRQFMIWVEWLPELRAALERARASAKG